MTKTNSYVTVPLLDLPIGEELPVKIFLHLDHRFITYRDLEDTVDSAAYERLMMRKVEFIFVREEDRTKFKLWAKQFDDSVEVDTVEAQKSPHYVPMKNLRGMIERESMDIFQIENPDKSIAAAVKVAKELVDTFMGIPYAIKPLSLLQNVSRNVSDHSLNVATLSVYLATQMGYTHKAVIENLGVGALLHDVGKLKIDIDPKDSSEVITEKLELHPELGFKYLEEEGLKVPKEVKMIVQQHHEFMDGTGYPQKFRGSAIYDLARLVTIANLFDKWVADEKGSIRDRQEKALNRMQKEMSQKLDPIKLEKVIKILRSGV